MTSQRDSANESSLQRMNLNVIFERKIFYMISLPHSIPGLVASPVEYLHTMILIDEEVLKVKRFIEERKAIHVMKILWEISFKYIPENIVDIANIIVEYYGPMQQIFNNKVLYKDAVEEIENGVCVKKGCYFTALMALEYRGHLDGFSENRLKVAHLLVDEGASLEGTQMS